MIRGRYCRYPPNITVHEEQRIGFVTRFGEMDTGLFYAFNLYGFSEVSAKVEPGDDLEPFVFKREVYFVALDWILSFPVTRPETGPYRNVSPSRFPFGLDYAAFHFSDKEMLFVPRAEEELATYVGNRALEHARESDIANGVA